MIKASIASIVFLIATLSAAPSDAQQSRVLSFEEQIAWAAVGRLTAEEYDGQNGCTAALVRSDLILTAGHCLGGLENAAASRLSNMRFYAGLNDGKIFAQSSISEVILSETYVRGQLNLDNIPADWALARLTRPITSIDPLPIIPLPGEWENVSLLAYSGIHRTSPVLSSNCPQSEFKKGVMLVRCPVVGGNSGAPVLLGSPPFLQIAAVISAKAQNFAFAVIPDETLLAHISERP